jgi:hypothetical protein
LSPYRSLRASPTKHVAVVVVVVDIVVDPFGVVSGVDFAFGVDVGVCTRES